MGDVFEHLTSDEANKFLAELKRVMKPSGILRLSVPDLEEVVHDYLKFLGDCLHDPSSKNVYRYQWAVMEIFDQMVREKSGGMMWQSLQQGTYDREYLMSRMSADSVCRTFTKPCILGIFVSSIFRPTPT